MKSLDGTMSLEEPPKAWLYLERNGTFWPLRKEKVSSTNSMRSLSANWASC